MLYLMLFSLIFASAFAFSKGPPWKMCSLMIPKHSGIQQQQTKAPYSIFVTKESYLPGDRITVILRSKPDGPPFKGFLLGAHQQNGDTENVVGKFVTLPVNSRGLSWYAEAENMPNCVSHNSNATKREIKFEWEAPKDSLGDVIFIAAFVKEFSVFWANVRSKPLKAADNRPLPPFPSDIQRDFQAVALRDSCGISKGCLLYPKGCSPDECEIAVAFQRGSDDKVQFEMFGRSEGYVSLAFSSDRLMGQDSTLSCTMTRDKEYASVQHGFNPAHNNERHRILNVTGIQMTRIGARIYCRFHRPIDLSVTTVAMDKGDIGTYSTVQFSLRKPWIAFLAVGALYEGTDVLYKHTLTPIISHEEVDFLSTKIFYASAFPLLVRLHGSFMLMAWMIFAGIGMVIAGNFKFIFRREVCGAALWLHLHRGTMLLTTALTLVGIAFIFVALGFWDDRATSHGAVGLSLVGLLVIQVIAGLARPSLDHPARWVFNLVHALLGCGSHICAAAAFLLAFQMPHLPEVLRSYMLIVLVSWIAFQAAWMLLLRFLRCWVLSEGRSKATVNAEGRTTSKKMNPVLILALIFYCITMIAFFAVSTALITSY